MRTGPSTHEPVYRTCCMAHNSFVSSVGHTERAHHMSYPCPPANESESLLINHYSLILHVPGICNAAGKIFFFKLMTIKKKLNSIHALHTYNNIWILILRKFTSSVWAIWPWFRGSNSAVGGARYILCTKRREHLSVKLRTSNVYRVILPESKF